MLAPVAARRPRVLRLVAAAAAGLVLVFGGTCGVGPTSLSLLAVSGTQTTVPDDARSQALVPVATEATAPARRVVRRRLGRLADRVRSVVAGLAPAVLVAVTSPRGPPPRRGPPLVAG